MMTPDRDQKHRLTKVPDLGHMLLERLTLGTFLDPAAPKSKGYLLHQQSRPPPTAGFTATET